jgi:hypothetical protein
LGQLQNNTLYYNSIFNYDPTEFPKCLTGKDFNSLYKQFAGISIYRIFFQNCELKPLKDYCKSLINKLFAMSKRDGTNFALLAK